MMVIVMPPVRTAEDVLANPLRRVPDAQNAAVQALIDQEVAARERSNLGLLARIFGKQATDRPTVLKELKAARVMDDDRYLLASWSQRRVEGR